MTIEATMATKAKARATFQDTLDRAGIERRELADASGVSVHTINSLANPASYGREGSTRRVTAWKLANAYAELAGITADDAYSTLFEDVSAV